MTFKFVFRSHGQWQCSIDLYIDGLIQEHSSSTSSRCQQLFGAQVCYLKLHSKLLLAIAIRVLLSGLNQQPLRYLSNNCIPTNGEPRRLSKRKVELNRFVWAWGLSFNNYYHRVSTRCLQLSSQIAVVTVPVSSFTSAAVLLLALNWSFDYFRWPLGVELLRLEKFEKMTE